MARITVEKVVENIGNRFEAIIIASIRARELKRGNLPFVKSKNGPIITALREIEEGHITRDYLGKVREDKKDD